ncbi:MAG TPA: hypothetical protein VGF87_10905, partial [Acidimicrobiales bacterium]
RLMKLFGRSDPVEAGEVRRVTGHPGEGVEDAVPHDGPTPVPTRLARLAAVVEGARRGRSDRSVRKILQVLGMLAVAFGFVCIILGWYGAAHSPYLYEEMPYLISGGVLGLALVLAGGILIWSAWSLRQVEEERRNALAIVRSIDRLERLLREIQPDGRLDGYEEAP